MISKLKVIFVLSIMLVAVTLTSCGETKKCIKLIEEIGEVSLANESKIVTAEEAYGALDEKAKSEVTNYNVLVAARNKYNAMVCDEMIETINATSLDDEAGIQEAERYYSSLGEEARQLVTKLNLLDEKKSELTLLMRYSVGDTVSTDLYEFTVKNTTFIKDKIKDGRATHIYSSNTKYTTRIEDLYISEGYACLKIDFSIKAIGKSKVNPDVLSWFEVDYDNGYHFYASPWNGSMPTTADAYSGYYTINDSHDTEFSLDPLSKNEGEGCVYIFMNEVAMTDTEAPLLLNIKIENNVFTYTLR